MNDHTPITLNTPIDIIITSYNYGNYLRRAIDSALKQSGSIKVIVVDDASSDDTQEIARTYSHITYIRNDQNLGYIGAMEKGLAASQAPLVCFLDADDELLPDFSKTLLTSLAQNPDAAFAYGQVQYFGERSDIYPSFPFAPLAAYSRW